MSETNNNLKFVGDIKFPTNFDVQITRPLDNRLVVGSVDDLLLDLQKVEEHYDEYAERAKKSKSKDKLADFISELQKDMKNGE